MVSLFGAIKRVSGVTAQNPKPRFRSDGTPINVQTPTHLSGVLEFQNGVTVTLIVSLDVLISQMPNVEIHGTLGTISAPTPYHWADLARIKTRNPNAYNIQPIGKLPLPTSIWKQHLRQFVRHPASRWQALKPPPNAYITRGCGLSEMVNAIQENRPHRASLEMSIHVLEAILGLLKSGETGTRVELETSDVADQP